MADAYSNYDQSVEIVGCWHSWFSSLEGVTFDHFPCVDIGGVERTPDFLAKFNQGYQLVGELCRLSMTTEGFRSSVEQAVGYAELSAQTDVMMLIPHDYADQAEKRMLDEGLLHATADSEPVVVLSFVRTDANRVTQWVFKRPSQFRKVSFRDGFLGELSLHHKMTVTLEGQKVPPKYLRDIKIRIPLCNDPPPALYLACVLWEKVFSSMLTDEDYVRARVERLKHHPLRVTPETVREAFKEQLDVTVRTSWIRRALELLEKARLAERPDKSKDEFTVKYGKVLVTGSAHSELHMLLLDRLFGKGSLAASTNLTAEQETLFGELAPNA